MNARRLFVNTTVKPIALAVNSPTSPPGISPSEGLVVGGIIAMLAVGLFVATLSQKKG